MKNKLYNIISCNIIRDFTYYSNYLHKTICSEKRDK